MRDEKHTYHDGRGSKVEVGAMCKRGKHAKCFVQDCVCVRDGEPCHGFTEEMEAA